MTLKCNKCHKEIKAGEEYRHHLKVLCEACSLGTRMTRDRKTHWQYNKTITEPSASMKLPDFRGRST